MSCGQTTGATVPCTSGSGKKLCDTGASLSRRRWRCLSRGVFDHLDLELVHGEVLVAEDQGVAWQHLVGLHALDLCAIQVGAVGAPEVRDGDAVIVCTSSQFHARFQTQECLCTVREGTAKGTAEAYYHKAGAGGYHWA